MTLMMNEGLPGLLRFFAAEDEAGAATPDEASAPATDLISGEGSDDSPETDEGATTAESEESADLISGGDGENEGTVSAETLDREAVMAALPEGFEVTDEKKFSELLDMIEGTETRQEIAEKILGFAADFQANLAQEQADQWAETENAWKEETRADPEYGGKNLEQARSTAKAIAQEYGGKEFLNLLSLTGAGNHVSMMRFLNRVAAAIPGEAKPVTGNPSDGGQRSLAERLFPNQEGN